MRTLSYSGQVPVLSLFDLSPILKIFETLTLIRSHPQVRGQFGFEFIKILQLIERGSTQMQGLKIRQSSI